MGHASSKGNGIIRRVGKNVSFALQIDKVCIVAVFDAANIDLGKPLVATCQTAMTACGIAAAAHLLGKEMVPVYNVSIS